LTSPSVEKVKVKAYSLLHVRAGDWNGNVTCYCTICDSSDGCMTDGTCYAVVFKTSESDESQHRSYG